MEENKKSDITQQQRRLNRSRFKAEPNAGMRLEARDRQLLCDLFLNRAMARSQIQVLYFGSVQRCNARLRLLFDHGFLTRYYPPAALFGAQAIYSVGRAAVPVVARDLEIEVSEVNRLLRGGPTPTFIEHTLATVDIWLGFRKSVLHSDSEIERWIPEIQCRHEYEIRGGGSGWRKEVFKPDAFIRFKAQNSGRLDSFFIEVDLGHTSSRQFLGKLLTHQRYLESGLFAETFGGDTFRTLVITTGSRRVANLSSLVREKQSDLFWFTTFDNFRSAPLGDNTWRNPSGEAEVLC